MAGPGAQAGVRTDKASALRRQARGVAQGRHRGTPGPHLWGGSRKGVKGPGRGPEARCSSSQPSDKGGTQPAAPGRETSPGACGELCAAGKASPRPRGGEATRVRSLCRPDLLLVKLLHLKGVTLSRQLFPS